MLRRVRSAVRTLFGYDAVKSSPRRSQPRIDMRSEDAVLYQPDRDRIVSTARDARRNFSVAAWAIRKHLDFVSDFSFQAHTGNDDLDDKIEAVIASRSTRHRCDAAGRHPLRRLLRIAEACRTVDGDCVVELVRDGALNVIRGDRIRNPLSGTWESGWRNGVRVDDDGRSIEYGIHTRTQSGAFRFVKFLPAYHAIHHAYWDDADQVRGISPLSNALNQFRDVYENIDYALAKMKIDQLMGLVISRGEAADVASQSPFAGNPHYRPQTGDDDADEAADAAAVDDLERRNKYGKVDYGQGLFQFELDNGDDVKMLATPTPSSQFQQFTATVIGMALKALDIPYSFYEENHTNFFGSRSALQLYLRSAVHKQADNQDLLGEITRFWLADSILDGELELPPTMTVSDIVFSWTPRGIPWWDRKNEIDGDLRAISSGLDNPQDICREHGSGDYFTNIDKTAIALKYAQEKLGPLGMQVSFAPAPADVATIKDQSEDEYQDPQAGRGLEARR